MEIALGTTTVFCDVWLPNQALKTSSEVSLPACQLLASSLLVPSLPTSCMLCSERCLQRMLKVAKRARVSLWSTTHIVHLTENTVARTMGSNCLSDAQT